MIKGANIIFLGKARRPVDLTMFLDHVIERLQANPYLTVTHIAKEYHLPRHVLYRQMDKLQMPIEAIKNGAEI